MPPQPPETVSSALVRRSIDFLRNEKGLAELSLKVYVPVAEDLLHDLKEEQSIRSVRRLDASLLRAFLFERAQSRSRECLRLLATSLRSFLRFLHAEGELPNDLTAAIPTVRRWTQPDIPMRTIAPRLPLTGPASIGHIVRRAMTKAGVERPMHSAAHLFGHTLASSMLQHGANLREISEVLRHQAHASTEIHAKIDRKALQEVARPWPGQGGVR